MFVRWITAFVDRPPDGFDEVAQFWCRASGSSLSAWRGDDGEFATLVPLDGADAHLRIQRTASGTSGSHLDLHVDDVAAGAEECAGLGARIVADRGRYVVVATPGGMPFCVVPHCAEPARQRPVALPSPTRADAPTTLVDQCCIDADADVFDAEVRFWSAVTGWSVTSSSASEFTPLERPPAMPLRLLLQRRAVASGPTTCHLDLASDDVPAAVAAHEGFGASVIDPRPLWTVMADPTGTTYCLTSRSPDSGLLAPR